MLKNNRLVTFVGTGGVGKTSLSFSVALQAAMQGRKVAAITIDPSRRLSSLLGLDEEDSDSKVVEFEGLSGSLEVFYVDTSSVFREFVSTHLGASLYSKLEKNGIYRQISKNLRETHNFAALYKMTKLLESEQYDLVILDTPPCHQVIEFFESPRRLQNFFSSNDGSQKSSWLSWVQDKGVRVVESFLKKLVGTEFVEEMDAFFRGVGGLRHDIAKVSETFIKSLARQDSNLVLIFPPALDKLDEARFLAKELERNELQVDHYLMNRAYIPGLDQSKAPQAGEDSRELKVYNYFTGQKQHSMALMQELRKDTGLSSQVFSMIPEIDQKMLLREDVLKFSQEVKKRWEKI